MGKNLRNWISEIEQIYSDELLRVKQTISPSKFEASVILEILERKSRYPAVLFENLSDLNGEPTSFRLIMNVFASLKKIGLALGLKDPSRIEIMNRYMNGQSLSKDVVVVKHRPAVKEVIWKGRDVNLYKLPVPRINEMDGGPYLTPLVIARHPDTGRYNLSWNRCMIIDKSHLGIWMSPRHLWSYFMIAERKDRNLPVALVLGHHPALFLAGAGLTKMIDDEYRVAGGILGEGVEVTASETYGEDLLIPAESEIVIEGEIVKYKRTIEGPFGEFTGYTGPQRLSWLIEAKSIIARKDGIIVNVFAGHQDNLYAHYPIQADIFTNVKSVLPNVIDVAWLDLGTPHTMAISLKKNAEGEQLRAAMAALSLSNFIKMVVLVDEDIDPGNSKQVLWAISTRVQPDKDINILKGIQGQVLDPSLEHEIKGSGMIIDATKPLDRPFASKAHPPEDLVERTNLEKYLVF